MMKTSTLQLLVTFVPSVFILLMMLVASLVFQVPMHAMTRDVNAIANLHPLEGFLSNLGILLWCAAATICGFTAFVLRNIKPRDMFWFFLCSSLLSAYLLFDDFFQFHEILAPRYLGLNETIVIAALGVSVLAYLVKFGRIIIGRTNYGVLVLAIGFLSTSVVVDLFQPWLSGLGHWRSLLEDGPKWLGIASWCSYYVHTCHHMLAGNFAALSERTSDRITSFGFGRQTAPVEPLPTQTG